MPTINKYHGSYNKSYRGGTGGIKYFVVHYTGGTGSARNNCIYFSNGNRNASADMFVDKDGAIWEYNDIDEGMYTWHCGDGNGRYGITNPNSVGVEVVSNGEDFTEAQIQSVAALYKYYNQKLGRTLEVVRHYDASRKQCPYPYVNESKWAALKARILGGSATATPSTPSTNTPANVSGSIDDLAKRVIAGEFGNGDARKAALGDKYAAVQARVNEILGGGGSKPAPSTPAPAPSAPASSDIDDLARRVINGEFGNGDARKAALGDKYSAVQARVNQMLGVGGGSAPTTNTGSSDIDDLARRVINGDFGNGEARKRALGDKYAAVQARVNQMLS